jgi:peptidoglycan/xylan/chitin deacetylase (PgdA/CDA1 family)
MTAANRTGAPASATSVPVLIPIILYHRVVRHGDRFSVEPGVFDEHLAAVRDSGRVPLSVPDVAAAVTGSAPLPARPVAVTFDDGTGDFHDTVLSRLRSAGLPATLYLTTAQLGRPGMLTWRDVVDAAEAGIEVGAHTRTHPHLDTVSRQRAQREIAGSRADVEEHLGRACRSFAYPHGSFDRKVRQAVSAAGFTSAVAVRNAFSHEQDDVLALARLTVQRDTSPEQVAGWLAGRGAPRSPRRERMRTTAFRQVRRVRAHLHPVPERIS